MLDYSLLFHRLCTLSCQRHPRSREAVADPQSSYAIPEVADGAAGESDRLPCLPIDALSTPLEHMVEAWGGDGGRQVLVPCGVKGRHEQVGWAGGLRGGKAASGTRTNEQRRLFGRT